LFRNWRQLREFSFEERTMAKDTLDPPHEQRIRERAFQIWIDEGQPYGRDKEHWQRAEREIASEGAPTTLIPDNMLADGGDGQAPERSPPASVSPYDLTR
jgi:hypothetical protein